MKKQVHYYILEDMEKYIKELNPNDYEISNHTEPSVIEFVRKYYDEHLPVDVTAWMRVNKPNPALIYANFLGDQVTFVRDILFISLLSPGKLNFNQPLVISTHYSKSVKLPVYQINLEKYGIKIVLRYNFYNWKVSVKSEKPLNFDFMGIFNPYKEISPIYCEGFPNDKIYGSFEKNPAQFTVEFISNYDLYTFIFLLKKYLGI